MPQGRPRLPGTEEERAAARRAQVREAVRNYRRRQSTNRNLQIPCGSSSSQETNQRRLEPQPLSRGLSIRPATQTDAPSSSGDLTLYRSLTNPLRLNLASGFAVAFIAPFYHRDVVDGVRHSTAENVTRIEINSRGWNNIWTLEVRSQGSHMLEDAIIACSLIILGLETNNEDIAYRGMQRQAIALRKLRNRFDAFVVDKSSQDATLLSGTAVLCSISDLFLNKCWDGFSTHLRGAGAILEHAGPSHLNTCTAQDHFLGYRVLQSTMVLLDRQLTFLRHPEWTYFPWRDGGIETPLRQASSDPTYYLLHTLLDIVFQISAQMNMYDTRSRSNPEDPHKQLRQLEILSQQLDSWGNDLSTTNTGITQNTEEAYWIDLPDGESIITSVNFRSNGIASIFTYYVGIRIAICNLARQLAEDLSDDDSQTSQSLIQRAIEHSQKCIEIARRCVEFFTVPGSPKGLQMGRLACLYTFDVIWETSVELGEKYDLDMGAEIEWCRVTAEKLTVSGLPVFRTHGMP